MTAPADAAAAPKEGGLLRLCRTAITVWALLGGVALLGVVAINVYSVVGGAFGAPFPGDFEITEVGVAVAAFAFLPYCQLYRTNVSADIFTAWASPRLVSLLSLLGSLTALGFSLLLIWRMYLGMLDQREYGYVTAILQFPHWMAFATILVSLALLALAAAITLIEDAVGRTPQSGMHV